MASLLHSLHPGLVWQSSLTTVVTIDVITYINLKCAVCYFLGDFFLSVPFSKECKIGLFDYWA